MGKLYLISGNDEFAIKARARALVVKLAGEEFEDNPALEIVRGDAEDLKAEAIVGNFLAALRTPPFLNPEKIVWLRSFAYFEAATAGSASEALLTVMKGVQEFFKEPLPPELTVIMDGPGVDQRKAFFKQLKTAGAECDFLRKADLASRDFAQTQNERIQAIAAAAGKRLEPAAVDYLIAAVGSDFGRLQSELEKIFCFLGEEAAVVRVEDCRAVCSQTPEALSWDFADALAERNPAAALRIVNILMQQLRSQRGGNLELSMLNNAVRTFQDILKAKQAAAELQLPRRIGSNYFSTIPDERKKALPGNMLLQLHPFRAFKLVERAGSFEDAELARDFDLLLEANRRLVSGGGEPRIVLEQLILKITGAKR